MAFCVECGMKLTEGARFCSSCGTKVADPAPAVEATPVAEAVSQEEIMNENVYASVAAEPVMESESVSAPEAEAPQAEPQNVCNESVQTPVYAPVVSVAQNEANASTSTKEEQQALLDNIYARLRNERLCWKIFGFVWIGYIVLFTLFALVSFPESLLFLFYTVYFAPPAVICFIMVGKVDNYMKTLYTDCAPVVERCSSVGMIVFGAIFNTVAMVFIIINFVNVTSNKKILEDIKRNQDAYRNQI